MDAALGTLAPGDVLVEGERIAAGIRALHCYGFFASTPGNPRFPDHAARRADFARVVRKYGGATGLVTIGAALTETGLVPWHDTVAEIEAARAHEARIVAHTACVWGSVVTGGVKAMAARGLLGPEQVHIHCNALSDDEWRLLARAGAKVSISPETELNMGMGRLAIGKCRDFGIAPTLGCDIVSLNSGDMFAQMRLALAHARFVENDRLNRAGAMPTSLPYTTHDALAWATVNGADACGLGAAVGSLRPGKQADVIVVGGDGFGVRPRHEPAGSVVFQATRQDVRLVLVAGKVVKRDGVLVGVDLPAALARGELVDALRRRDPAELAAPRRPDAVAETAGEAVPAVECAPAEVVVVPRALVGRVEPREGDGGDAVPGLPGVEDGDARPTDRQVEGDRGADDPGPDDDVGPRRVAPDGGHPRASPPFTPAATFANQATFVSR